MVLRGDIESKEEIGSYIDRYYEEYERRIRSVKDEFTDIMNGVHASIKLFTDVKIHYNFDLDTQVRAVLRALDFTIKVIILSERYGYSIQVMPNKFEGVSANKKQLISTNFKDKIIAQVAELRFVEENIWRMLGMVLEARDLGVSAQRYYECYYSNTEDVIRR